MSPVRDFLRRQCDAGDWLIGQIHVSPNFELRHVDDATAATPEVFTRPEDAREIAKYDAAGNYRPLKTAPNLRRGWRLGLADIDALRLALDLFYPAALGTWLAAHRGELRPVALRETLARQTGMYRVTQLLRDDQATELIGKTCERGCLRPRLWRIDSVDFPADTARESATTIPVLCVEACNLLVAACRPLARENLPKSP